jgi:nitrate/TMAO reductase-like tetraheme cytochrome c subunit
MLLSQANAGFGENKACQKCHPQIYDEFYNSSHRKSSIFNDPIHKAVWDKHPLKEKEKYNCAKCHSPTDKALLQNLRDGKPAQPQSNQAQLEDGISCISCHTIESIKEHDKSNENILSQKEKTLFSARVGEENQKEVGFTKTNSFFGLFSKKSGSPYHKIDYSNKAYYDGDMCMGCHSHKKNVLGFELCKTDLNSTTDKKTNCISCHMPSVKGTMNTIEKTETHKYHGFAGASNRPDLLSKYVKIDFKTRSKGFEINIKNQAEHDLFLHPLRVAELRIEIERADKTIPLDPKRFKKVIGAEGKASMPWLANSVIKDTQIQANETREISYDIELKKGDQIKAILGFYLLSEKASQKLGLSENKELSKFRILKQKIFQIE